MPKTARLLLGALLLVALWSGAVVAQSFVDFVTSSNLPYQASAGSPLVYHANYGQVHTITVQFRNNTGYPLTNVAVSLSSTLAPNTVIDPAVRPIPSLPNNALQTVTFTVYENATPALTPDVITGHIVYDDPTPAHGDWPFPNGFRIRLERAAVLGISDIAIEPSGCHSLWPFTLGLGADYTVTATVTNQGEDLIVHTDALLEITGPGAIITPPNPVEINNLVGGGTVVVTYTCRTASPGDMLHAIRFTDNTWAQNTGTGVLPGFNPRETDDALIESRGAPSIIFSTPYTVPAGDNLYYDDSVRVCFPIRNRATYPITGATISNFDVDVELYEGGTATVVPNMDWYFAGFSEGTSVLPSNLADGDRDIACFMIWYNGVPGTGYSGAVDANFSLLFDDWEDCDSGKTAADADFFNVFFMYPRFPTAYLDNGTVAGQTIVFNDPDNLASSTQSTIAGVEYRYRLQTVPARTFDGWTAATPTDGSWNSGSEVFNFTTPTLTENGCYDFQARALDGLGVYTPNGFYGYNNVCIYTIPPWVINVNLAPVPPIQVGAIPIQFDITFSDSMRITTIPTIFVDPAGPTAQIPCNIVNWSPDQRIVHCTLSRAFLPAEIGTAFLHVLGAQNAYGVNMVGEYHAFSFLVEEDQPPTILDIVMSPDPAHINDRPWVSIVFSEPMNPSFHPSVYTERTSITNRVGYSTSRYWSSTYLPYDTWNARADMSLPEETPGTINYHGINYFYVIGPRDLQGNILNAVPYPDGYEYDLIRPWVTVVSYDPPTGILGSPVRLCVTYNEDMNTGVNPSIIFAPPGVTTYDCSTSPAWTSATTYCVTTNVAINSLMEGTSYFRISGGRDDAQNIQSPNPYIADYNSNFSAPTVTNMVVYPTWPVEGSTCRFDITFNHPMMTDWLHRPVVTYNANGHIVSCTGAPLWSIDRMTYSITADTSVVASDNGRACLSISDARDIGDIQQVPNPDTRWCFNIDADPPSVINVVMDPRWPRASQRPAFWATYDEDMDLAVLPWMLYAKQGSTNFNINTLEAGVNGLTTDDPSLWQYGNPGTSGPNNAHSGTHIFGTRLNADYPNDADGSLITPVFYVGSNDLPMIGWWQWYNLEATYDYVRVEVWNGVSWVSTARNYTGTATNWNYEFLDLTPWVGMNIQVRWHLTTDGSVTRAGYFIDDIAYNCVGCNRVRTWESDRTFRCESDRQIPVNFDCWYTLYVYNGQDPAGNLQVANPYAWDFLIDNTVPVTTVGGLPIFTGVSTFQVPFNFNDGLCSSGIRQVDLRYRMDVGGGYGAWQNGPSLFNLDPAAPLYFDFTAPMDGHFQFEASGTDSALNVEGFTGTPEDEILVDATGPELILDVEPSSPRTDLATYWRGHAIENFSTVAEILYRWYPISSPPPSTWTLASPYPAGNSFDTAFEEFDFPITFPGGGTYIVEVTGRNSNGAYSAAILSRTIIIDLTAPVVDIVTPTARSYTPAEWISVIGNTITGTAGDAGSGISWVQFRVYSFATGLYFDPLLGTFTNPTGWYAPTGLTSWSYTMPATIPNGTYQVQARASDGMGNMASDFVGFVINATPPTRDDLSIAPAGSVTDNPADQGYALLVNHRLSINDPYAPAYNPYDLVTGYEYFYGPSYTFGGSVVPSNVGTVSATVNINPADGTGPWAVYVRVIFASGTPTPYVYLGTATAQDNISPAATANALIRVNAGQIQLDWEPVTLGHEGTPENLPATNISYRIYRSTQPLFSPPGGTLVATTTGTTWTDPTAGTVGNTATNYFYNIIVVDGSGNESVPFHNNLGEFDYQVLASSTRFSAIGIPFINPYMGMSPVEGLSGVYDAMYPSAELVVRYASGLWASYIPGIPETSVPLFPGDMVLIGLATGVTNRVVTITGWVPNDGELCYHFTIATTRRTAFVLPFAEDALIMANLLAAQVPDCDVLLTWIPGSYWEAYIADYGAVNYPTRTGYPYVASVLGESWWPCTGLRRPVPESGSGMEIGSGVPKVLTGMVSYPDGTVPAALRMRAWRTANPSEVITESYPGSLYIRGQFALQLGHLPTSWSVDDEVVVEVTDPATGDVRTFTARMDDHGIQTLGREVMTVPTTSVASIEAIATIEPNPTSGAATLTVSMTEEGTYSVELYTLLGNKLRAWDLGANSPNVVTLNWDGTDGHNTCPDGAYFFRILKDGMQTGSPVGVTVVRNEK